jgi:Sec-independent protein translocase protein TatA
MFNAPEILFLAFLGILLVGPKRLPDLARQFARILLRIRQVKAELESQISTEINNIAEISKASFEASPPTPPTHFATVEPTTMPGDGAASFR